MCVSSSQKETEEATANSCLIFPSHLVLSVICCTYIAEILKGIKVGQIIERFINYIPKIC